MVHFVGAGSGAPDLITLRGEEAAGKCRYHNLCRLTGESPAFGL